MTEAKTILILGAGIGGQVAATRLRKKLPQQHRVVLIERDATFLFQPSLLWLMTGKRSRDKIRRPYAALKKKGIELISGEVTYIDPHHRLIRVGQQEYQGDFLIIALGAELAPDAIPGLPEAGYNLYSLEGAQAFCDARFGLRRGRMVLLVGGTPFKCPAAPYEAAMLLESDCRKRSVREGIDIELYTPEPGPMAVAGPQISTQVRQMVESKGVGYYPEHTIRTIDATGKTLTFTNGVKTSFDLLGYIPIHKVPSVVVDAGLVNASGWIPVDCQSLETCFPGVYAIGDVTGIPLTMGKPLPKAGVFAHGQAETVADNLVHRITGKGKPTSFTGHGECFLETGDGKAGFGSGNFYAQPIPRVQLRQPGRLLHLAKILYEKYWLYYRL